MSLKNKTPEEKLGRIIVFPSMLMHAVQPVTKGNRSSLVLWGRRTMKKPPAYVQKSEEYEATGQSKKED